jgi:hypothetical protein
VAMSAKRGDISQGVFLYQPESILAQFNVSSGELLQQIPLDLQLSTDT